MSKMTFNFNLPLEKGLSIQKALIVLLHYLLLGPIFCALFLLVAGFCVYPKIQVVIVVSTLMPIIPYVLLISSLVTIWTYLTLQKGYKIWRNKIYEGVEDIGFTLLDKRRFSFKGKKGDISLEGVIYNYFYPLPPEGINIINLLAPSNYAHNINLFLTRAELIKSEYSGKKTFLRNIPLEFQPLFEKFIEKIKGTSFFLLWISFKDGFCYLKYKGRYDTRIKQDISEKRTLDELKILIEFYEEILNKDKYSHRVCDKYPREKVMADFLNSTPITDYFYQLSIRIRAILHGNSSNFIVMKDTLYRRIACFLLSWVPFIHLYWLRVGLYMWIIYLINLVLQLTKNKFLSSRVKYIIHYGSICGLVIFLTLDIVTPLCSVPTHLAGIVFCSWIITGILILIFIGDILLFL